MTQEIKSGATEADRGQPRVRPLRDLEPGRDPSVGSGEPEPSLSDYLATLAEGRWLIVVSVIGAVAAAVAFVLLKAPTYRADILVQVEEKTEGKGGLDALSDLLGSKTPAETEMEIIRSRYLVGSVVDQLALDVAARPRTFPLVGGAMFRRRAGLDEVAAPLLGLRRYAWGGERITVTRVTVPEWLLGRPLTLVAQDGGKFVLHGPEGEEILEGTVGEASAGEVSPPGSRKRARVELFVSELRGRPGTEFRVVRSRRSEVIQQLQQTLNISEKGKKTGVLQVALEGGSPERVTSTLDAIANTYLRQNVERKSAVAEKTLAFLQQQLPALKGNVDAAEVAIERYQKTHGSVDVTLETGAAIDREVEIEKGLAETDVQLAELREKFTDSHPVIATLKQKMAQMRGEKEKLDARLKNLPTAELDSARLMRDAKVATELYVLLLNKAQELRVVKEGTIGNVRILDTAVLPYEPVSPKKGSTLVLSLVLGLAVGLTLAFVKQAFSNGLNDPDVVERQTGLSVFASVPRSERELELWRRAGKRARVPVLVDTDPDDLAVESMRSLRTSLQFALVDAPSRILAVLGPSPAGGKTFISVNLAYVLAEQGKRVVLVDADLRKGRLHKYLDGKRENGLSEVIGGTLPLEAAIRRSGENVDIISSGKTPPNSSALLASESFQRIVAELAGRYDFVVLDTPPVLAVTDATLVARLAGVNLLVLRAGQHAPREIALTLKRLEQGGARVHGVVMNDMHTGMGSRRYAYYYRYDRDSEVAS